MNPSAPFILAAVITPEFQFLNYLEAGLWLVIAAGAALRARGVEDRILRRDLAILAIALAAFGISDVVEVQTGAWWRPWWLLLWKGACLAVLLGLLIAYVRRRRHAR